MSVLQKICLSKIDSFKNHPFKVNDDDSLKNLANSIKENGLLSPLTVRPKDLLKIDKRIYYWPILRYKKYNK